MNTSQTANIGNCPNCNSYIKSNNANNLCQNCGTKLPDKITALIGSSGSNSADVVSSAPALSFQINYSDTTWIGFLRAIGWIDLIAGIIAAILIFANAKKSVPGEYLFAIGLSIAVAFQGIAAAVLFSVIASLAENVIAIRKQMSSSKDAT